MSMMAHTPELPERGILQKEEAAGRSTSDSLMTQ